MDTDIRDNTPEDLKLTRHLYGGDREYRIRQEMLLGVGGLAMLDKLGIKPDVCHLNEGHAAFCSLERIARLVENGKTLDQSIRQVRSSTVFTTHTPVPAGNDRFDLKLTQKYIAHYAKRLKIDFNDLLAMGREDPSDKSEPYCMTVLALKTADHCNGVAALHGEVSRNMWLKVFNQSDPDRVPIGSITNGIHSQTWLAPEMRPVYDRYLKPNWDYASPEVDPFKHVSKIPDAELWSYRNLMRARLVHFIRQRLLEQITRGHGSVEELSQAYQTFDPQALTIGFARRFATYKRAPLIFHHAKRLAKILNNDKKPVQLVFAGKAHPADQGGQSFAASIYRHAKESGFAGRVVILEDYDMYVGRALTSGADVWLNNPLRPQEASGTSGMKPPLHGGVNLSVLDGWWPEGFNGKNGWAIGGKQFADQKQQDAFDADCIYNLLEKQVVPMFYNRDSSGVAKKWVAMMKESIRTVCHEFSTTRMVAEYATRYYLPACK